MRFKNEITGDIMEVPPPDRLGASVVLFNGKVVEHVLYSDQDNSATLGDGQKFYEGQFAEYLRISSGMPENW